MVNPRVSLFVDACEVPPCMYGQETMAGKLGWIRVDPSAVKVITASDVKAELQTIKEQGDVEFDFKGIRQRHRTTRIVKVLENLDLRMYGRRISDVTVESYEESPERLITPIEENIIQRRRSPCAVDDFTKQGASDGPRTRVPAINEAWCKLSSRVDDSVDRDCCKSSSDFKGSCSVGSGIDAAGIDWKLKIAKHARRPLWLKDESPVKSIYGSREFEKIPKEKEKFAKQREIKGNLERWKRE